VNGYLQTFPNTSDTLLQSPNSAAQAPDTSFGMLVQLLVDAFLVLNGDANTIC
jgi:hypothetical protein